MSGSISRMQYAREVWPPKGYRLTKEERAIVPVMFLFASDRWCHGSAYAGLLRRPVPYVETYQDGTQRVVEAVFYDIGKWPRRLGDYPPCVNWRPPPTICGDSTRDLEMRELQSQGLLK